MPSDSNVNQTNVRKMIAARGSRPSAIDIFVLEQKSKNVKKKPKFTKDAAEKMRGNLFSKRNKITAIREAASRRVSIIMTYTKVTTGETKKYELNPISYRMRRLKSGLRKVLFAEDKRDKQQFKQIKNFVVRNIQSVALTDLKFHSKWFVEIAPRR